MIRSWHKTNVIIPYTPDSLHKTIQLHEYSSMHVNFSLEEAFCFIYDGQSIYYMEKQ